MISAYQGRYYGGGIRGIDPPQNFFLLLTFDESIGNDLVMSNDHSN